MSNVADYHNMAEEWRVGHGKAMNVFRSMSAIVSLILSALLVCTIIRTRDRLSTTYHRLLLGMSIADLLASSSSAIFGAAVPSEMAYLSWNASVNIATCDAQGFINILGAGKHTEGSSPYNFMLENSQSL